MGIVQLRNFCLLTRMRRSSDRAQSNEIVKLFAVEPFVEIGRRAMRSYKTEEAAVCPEALLSHKGPWPMCLPTKETDKTY